MKSAVEEFSEAKLSIKNGNVESGLMAFYTTLTNSIKGTKVITEYSPLLNPKLPERIDQQWYFKGEGRAEISNNSLRLVGINGCKATYLHHLDLSNGKDLVADVIMRRQSGTDEDCVLWIDDGTKKEVIRFNRGYVYLQSSNSRYNIATDEYHAYRLIMEKGTSYLFIDGELELHSDSLIKGSKCMIGFGCIRGISNADSENHWALVRLCSGESILGTLHSIKDIENTHYHRAISCFHENKVEESLHELSKFFILNRSNTQALDLLQLIIKRMNSVDASIHTIDKIINRLKNPQMSSLWEKTSEQLFRNKLIIAKNVGVQFSIDNVNSLASLWDGFFTLKGTQNSPKFRWALRDVSIDVSPGEIVGIIGKNGAGKSTLLRVLSGILSPDEGAVEIRGNAIILSPGLGFRDELSGKDNIYLGGLFLGMRLEEIKIKFDEIIDFAELRDDINKPFKFYSDGMKSRLMFSLATSVDPDILMLDELLSAGDASFVAKASRRMEEVVKRASCAVVVTHNLKFVRELCTRTLYLERGFVKYFGDPNKAVDLYLRDSGLFE